MYVMYVQAITCFYLVGGVP